MATKNYPPFMNSTGLISRILEKIRTAATPQRFTQDFLATELGFPGGSAKPFISLAKKIGLIGSDGTPTDLYRQFRNTNSSISKAAMAEAIKKGYPEIYTRNEYAHSLSKQDLEGLVVELTGLEKGNATVRAIVGTFQSLKAFADFKAIGSEKRLEATTEAAPDPAEKTNASLPNDVSLGLSYTINLVLPKTDDVAVFNAIFKSLRENLLQK